MSTTYRVTVEFSDENLVVVQVHVDGDILIFQGGYSTLFEAIVEARDAIKRDRDLEAKHDAARRLREAAA